MTSLPGPQSQAINQSYQNDETYEMILTDSIIASTPKKPKGATLVASSQETSDIDQSPSTSRFNSRAIARIAIAVAVGAASGLFVGGVVVSRDTIRELRSEFKKDLDSLRADIEHDLGVHKIATAALVHRQTPANERATEVQHHRRHQQQHTESGVTVNVGEDEAGVHSTAKDISDSRLVGYKPCTDLLNDGSRLREGQAPFADILPTVEWINTIRGWLQAVKITAIASCDWIQKKILRLRNLRSDNIAATIMHWVQNTKFPPTIDLYALALRYPFQDGLFFSAVLRLFLLLLVTYCVAYDWISERLINLCRGCRGVCTSKEHKDDDSLPPARGEESSNESRKDGLEESIPELVERKEDAIMEQVFYDSVAAAIRLPGDPRSDASSKQNYNTHHLSGFTRSDNVSATAVDSFPPFPYLPPSAKISKKEKLRRARMNAQAFGARDALKLSKVATGTTADAAAAKRSPVTKPSPTAPSPWHVKQQRLARARANGKLFGERDNERIRQAMIDSPWRKKTNTRSDALR